MTRMTLALLAACVVAAGVPFAGATHDENSEKRADCENADNQGWIGYNSTRTARYVYENASKTSPFNTAVVDNCEGEHWDGQDTVNNDEANEPTTTSDTACTPKPTETSASDFAVTNCQRADINQNGDGPLGRAPVGFRVSGKQAGAAYQEAYVGLDIMLVGRVAVYAGTCTEGSRGLEGAAECQNGDHARQTRSAVYLRDNTPQNVLAQAVSAAGVTRGEAGEGDCTQERYNQGVEWGSRRECTRDNTAITVDTLLP